MYIIETIQEQQDFSFDPLFAHTLSLLEPLTLAQITPEVVEETKRKQGRPRLDSMIVGDRMDDDNDKNNTSPIPIFTKRLMQRDLASLVSNEDFSLTNCYTYLAQKYNYPYNQIYFALNS